MRPQPGIYAALGQQFGMRALLGDAAGVEHDEPVQCRDGGEAVGDGDDGLALHQGVQALLDGGFHFRIERARGLVQQQDGCVLQHDPGDGHALALATRQLHSALAHLRVVAAAALQVGELVDEGGGFRAFGGLVHLRVRGIGAAVEDVVAHRSMQQGGVLRDHADGLAKAVLGHVGDVLAIDEHAAGLDVVEAQQQVHERGLARTGASDEADALAGPYGQVQVVDHRASRLVAEGHALERHLAARHRQGTGVRCVHHGAGAGEGVDAVLDGADALEQRGHFPHDPVRMARDPQRHGRDRRHRARAYLAHRPEPQCRAAGSQDHGHDQYVVDDLEGADKTHLRIARVLEGIHGRAGEFRLAPRVGEQLDGGDVGVGVGDAARHHGAGIGLRLAHLAQPWHEVPAGGGVAQHPQREGHEQPDVEAGGQRKDGDQIDAHSDHHIGGREDHVAHGQRSLHDLGGDAAGELVRIEGHALAEHQAVEVPAQPQREVDGEHLVLHTRLQDHQPDAGHHQARDQPEGPPVLRPEAAGSRSGQPVHQVPEHREKDGLIDGDGRRQRRHRHHMAAQALRAGPHESHEALGRQCGFGGGVGGDAVFEVLEHGQAHS